MPRTQRPKSDDVRAIGSRLIELLKHDFGLSMTEAAAQLEYANATTLHKVRRGLALPDPSRLARFADAQRILPKQTVNLHWVWTGEGPRLLTRAQARSGSKDKNDKEVDFINTMTKLSPAVKEAILVLLARESRRA